jgi:hypothetical protein
MKKSNKKLSLARETLVSLETGWQGVVGGTDIIRPRTGTCVANSCGGTCSCGDSVQVCCA